MAIRKERVIEIDEHRANDVARHARSTMLTELPEWIRNTLSEGNFQHSKRKVSQDVIYGLTLTYAATKTVFTHSIVLSLNDSGNSLKRSAAGHKLGMNMSQSILRYRNGSGKKWFDESKAHDVASREMQRASSASKNILISPATSKIIRASLINGKLSLESNPTERGRSMRKEKPKSKKVCKICGPEDQELFPAWPKCPHEV